MMQKEISEFSVAEKHGIRLAYGIKLCWTRTKPLFQLQKQVSRPEDLDNCRVTAIRVDWFLRIRLSYSSVPNWGIRWVLVEYQPMLLEQ
jgi:hypothetical protein